MKIFTAVEPRDLLQRLLLKSVLVLAALSPCTSSYAQFVHTQGTQIVDAGNKPIFLAGPNLGNWLVFEGYMLDVDVPGWRTPSGFRLGVKYALSDNESQTAQFVQHWRATYVTGEAIRQIKALGFNAVRVPFHYNMFWNGSSLTDAGFQYFDMIIRYCRENDMYVQFDMHAAPGFQNPGHHSDNPQEQVRDSVMFWANWSNVEIAARIWRHIAQRYANEPVIWSWDLLNEPVTRNDADKARLVESYRVMTDAIRQVDRNHIISAEGDWWGSDFGPLNTKWDNNLVFHTHHYPGQGEQQNHDTHPGGLGDRLRKARAVGVPMWMGEFGENTDQVLRHMTDWLVANNVGYAPWSFKRIETGRALWSIQKTAGFNAVMSYIKSGSYPNRPPGSPPANAFQELMGFANVAKNAGSNVSFVPSFYNAVKPKADPPRTCSNTPHAGIPARIEAESFCAMNGVQLENTADQGGGQNVGFLDVNDWMDFNINVPAAGTYTLSYRVASELNSGQVEFRAGPSTLASTNVPATGGWQTWTTLQTVVSLAGGQQAIRLHISGAPFNINWFELRTSQQQSAFSILSRHSNKALDVQDASTADGARIQQWDYQGNANQKWRLTDLGGGQFQIVSVSSNKCLNVQGAATGNGAGIEQRACNADKSQQWRVVDVGGGFHRIENVNSGRALDVTDWSTSNGTGIQQWEWTGGNNQQWSLNVVQ